MLEQIAIFLAAAVLVVPLFKKLGLGTVLGYLIAGILIGPWIFGFIDDVESILDFSEFGVVLLLFIIGLELKPSRLWVLRHSVFGLGSSQLLITTIPICLIAMYLGINWNVAVIIGLGMAMSSTAFILQTLSERKELSTRHGRDAFAILLFQDISVIPLLALMPLLSIGIDGNSAISHTWEDVIRAIIIIVIMVLSGRPVLRLLFRGVSYFGNREIFTAATLLVVIATALIMEHAGISMSLGAFMAGVLLADSEFRHQIEAEIESFKGLLLGLFFIAVGMSVNLGLIISMPLVLLGLVFLMMAVKFIVLYCISAFLKVGHQSARNLAITMAAGGEFAFVLFTVAGNYKVISHDIVDILIVIISLSMLVSPFLFVLNDRILSKIGKENTEPEFDRIDEPGNPVIIIGFGRVGQIISRILHMRDIHFTALESNPSQVDFVRKFGSKIYYGDATRIDLLRAARVNEAKLIMLTINDIETSLKIVELLRYYYPQVPIYARAHNRYHCYKLMDLDIKVVYRDTFYSSLELAKDMLTGLGFSRQEAVYTVDTFRNHDETLLKKQHAIYHDEAALIESVVKSRAELQTLFESDTSSKIDTDTTGNKPGTPYG